MNAIEQNWYIIGGLIAMFILYWYKNRSPNLNRHNKNDISMLIEIIFFSLVIITIQDKLFSDHSYFIVSLPIFIPIWTLFILYLLAKNDMFLIESRIQGEMFYQMGLIPDESGIKEHLVSNTGILLHRMDKGYYENLEHFGNPATPFQNVGDRVKHCDFFNGKMIYHPENPLLHNISFWASQTTWITFKKIIPDIMKTNLVLTDLVDTKIMSHINEMSDNLPYAMIGVREQYKHKPFDLDKSINDKIKILLAESRKNLVEKESKPLENENNYSPVKIGGD